MARTLEGRRLSASIAAASRRLAIVSLLASGAACQDEPVAPCRAGRPEVLAVTPLVPQGRAPSDPHLVTMEEDLEATPTLAVRADGRVVLSAWQAVDKTAIQGRGVAEIVVVDDVAGSVVEHTTIAVAGDAGNFVRTTSGIVTLGTRTEDGRRILEATFVSERGVADAPLELPGASCAACSLEWSARVGADRVSIVWAQRTGSDAFSGPVRFAQLDMRGRPVNDGELGWAAPPAALRASRGLMWIEAGNGSWRVSDDLAPLAGPLVTELGEPLGSPGPPDVGASLTAWGEDGAWVAWRAGDGDDPDDALLVQPFDGAGRPRAEARFLARGTWLAMAVAEERVAVAFYDSARLWLALATPDGDKLGGDLPLGARGPSASEHLALAVSLRRGPSGAAYIASSDGLARVEIDCGP